MVLLLISQNFCQLLLKTIAIVIIHRFRASCFASGTPALRKLMSPLHQIIDVFVRVLLPPGRQYDSAFADRYACQSEILRYDYISAYNMVHDVQINGLVTPIHLNDINAWLRLEPMVMRSNH